MRGTPFMYVLDGSALVDGATYLRFQVPLDNDSDFVLRHVSGMNSLLGPVAAPAGQWRMYDAEGRPCADAVQRTSQFFADHTVVPESVYPRGSLIRLDLQGVLRWSDAFWGWVPTMFYQAQAVFQGVLLTGKPTASELEPEPGAERQNVLPYTYVLQLVLNWQYWGNWPAAPTPNASREFQVPILNHDFWLHDIQVVRSTGVVEPPNASNPLFAVVLYGSDGETRLMSAPVIQWHLNSALNIDYGAAIVPHRVSHFPYPGVFYRKDSVIRVAITSLLANSDPDFPRTYFVSFRGLRRES